MYDLIVIGAGPGGYEAAAHAGRLGRKVALVEKERIGGACLNVGCIPAKAFLRSSRLCRECREAAAFGVHVGAFGFDLPAVVARKNGIVAALVKGIGDTLQRAHVDIFEGQARLTARDRVQVGGQALQAANILIATGARPAVPPVPGIGSARVIDSDAAFDLSDIPGRVAIIGAGYVGLEFATFFSDIGADVAVFEMLPQVAGGCDRDVADRLQQCLRRGGVRFHLPCEVLGVDDGTVRFADGSGPDQACQADLILNATGRVPVVAGLGLEDAGVDFSAAGIPVTGRGQTNVPGIWACGDVTGQHMLAHAATREGIVAVNNMFGKPDRVRYDALPAVIYTHPEVAWAGRTEEELKAAAVRYDKTVVPMGVSGRFLIENEHGSGFLKLLTGATYGEILGVHAVADWSSEFIVAASALIETELGVNQAAEIVFPHPTVSEVLREAIRRAQGAQGAQVGGEQP
jgi:dihydrolipoamide dehydrogenase